MTNSINNTEGGARLLCISFLFLYISSKMLGDMIKKCDCCSLGRSERGKKKDNHPTVDFSIPLVSFVAPSMMGNSLLITAVCVPQGSMIWPSSFLHSIERMAGQGEKDVRVKGLFRPLKVGGKTRQRDEKNVLRKPEG